MNVIGIAGPSCSGKSTVAALLADRLQAHMLSLDMFFIKGIHLYVEHEGQRIRTFERPEQYDGQRLAEVLRSLQGGMATFDILEGDTYRTITLTRRENIVVEGFLLYTYPALKERITHKFYLDIPEEEMLRRRRQRADRINSDASFLQIGMREYALYGLPQRDLPGVIVLDGMRSPEEIVDVITGHL